MIDYYQKDILIIFVLLCYGQFILLVMPSFVVSALLVVDAALTKKSHICEPNTYMRLDSIFRRILSRAQPYSFR